VNDLRDDPEYEILWPNDILARAVDRLIERGHTDGRSTEWHDEVSTLLRQAFRSTVPAEEFQQCWDESAARYDPSEEPF
jgi:hypothetical protein